MPTRTPKKGRAVRDEFERLLAEQGTFWIIILGVVIVKWAWSETKRTWRDWVRHISVAVFVGGLLNLYLADIPPESLGDGTKGVIIGLVVLQADHLFVGLMRIGSAFRDDPVKALRGALDIWRGRK